MISRKMFFALLVVVILIATISLTGCGTSSPAAGGGSVTLPVYYVNAATGADTNAGTQAAPFKTITKALAMASTGAATNIYVAPGTYNAANGEVFPLKIASSGINMVGDVATKGSTTIISGTGTYTATVGGVYSGTLSDTLVFIPGVTATVQGFTINGNGAGTLNVVIDTTNTGTATLLSNTINAGSAHNVTLMINSRAILTNNVITGATNVAVGLDASASVTLRGNNITQTTGSFGAVLSGEGAKTGQVIDMGTAPNPGNNIITGGANNVGLYLMSATASNVSAVGNAWKANVQGADAAGHYAANLALAGTAFVAGNNYANPTGTSGIQFYTQGGSAQSSIK